jgi:hypothetical protein
MQAVASIPALTQTASTEMENKIGNLTRAIETHFRNQGLAISSAQLGKMGGGGGSDYYQKYLDWLKEQQKRQEEQAKKNRMAGLLGAGLGALGPSIKGSGQGLIADIKNWWTNRKIDRDLNAFFDPMENELGVQKAIQPDILNGVPYYDPLEYLKAGKQPPMGAIPYEDLLEQYPLQNLLATYPEGLLNLGGYEVPITYDPNTGVPSFGELPTWGAYDQPYFTDPYWSDPLYYSGTNDPFYYAGTPYEYDPYYDLPYYGGGETPYWDLPDLPDFQHR